MSLPAIRTLAFLALLLAPGCGGSLSRSMSRSIARAAAGSYNPRIDPADFQPVVDNPYFPLVPGSVFEYAGHSGREPFRIVVRVTAETKTILGIPCVVVHETVTQAGTVREESDDWYAQDHQGRVWYFGEATRRFRADGTSETKGSWQAGQGDARPGLVFEKNPVPGRFARLEYAPGSAEELAEVVSVNDSTRVPSGRSFHCIRVRQWSRLEPGMQMKWYAKGVGLVRSESSSRDGRTVSFLTSTIR